jgi:site-specific DNA-methyltransferase (adenine-specific)
MSNKTGFSTPNRANNHRAANNWNIENILPPLTPDEYASLKESIRQFGVQVPIIVDKQGNIIDGKYRERARKELGINCTRVVRTFDSNAEKLQVAISLNCHRRHLKPSQRRELIATYLKTDPRINDTHLGEIIGVSKNTVNDVRKELERTRQIDKFNKLRGRDGKERPSTYKKIIANTPKEVETALRIIDHLPENCNGKTLDINTAKRRAKRLSTQIRLNNEVVLPTPNDNIRLYHCPFQQIEQIAGLAPSSVRAVITDVPYGKDFVPQFRDLAALAQRVLVDGGVFVTYYGHLYLFDAMKLLAEHLDYAWMGCVRWDGVGMACYPRNVISRWKPIIIYSKGPWKTVPRWYDVILGTGLEKDLHEWQQPVAEFEMLVRYFSQPGDLILDPCAGAFTTALACRNQGRRFIGCDVDETCIQKGQMRLAEEAA